MRPLVLEFDDRVKQLEEKNLWKTVTEYVYSKWEQDPMNIMNVLCAGTELWYSVLILDFLRNDPKGHPEVEFEDEDIILDKLNNVTRFGLDVFADNAMFNMFFGYMFEVRPYLFMAIVPDYVMWEEKGTSMLKKAYVLMPHDPVAKAMAYSTYSGESRELFEDACKELWEKITHEEWGNSLVQDYFFQALLGERYYPG